MRTRWMAMVGAVACLGGLVVFVATEATATSGLVADRHELMEGIGDDAKAIGGAAKTGDTKAAAAAAKRIQAAAPKIAAVFPKGSAHADSRAKPEIWDNWERFVQLAKDLETAAAGVVKVAEEGGNLGATTGPLFRTCKGCHDAFRMPDEE